MINNPIKSELENLRDAVIGQLDESAAKGNFNETSGDDLRSLSLICATLSRHFDGCMRNLANHAGLPGADYDSASVDTVQGDLCGALDRLANGADMEAEENRDSGMSFGRMAMRAMNERRPS